MRSGNGSKGLAMRSEISKIKLMDRPSTTRSAPTVPVAAQAVSRPSRRIRIGRTASPMRKGNSPTARKPMHATRITVHSGTRWIGASNKYQRAVRTKYCANQTNTNNTRPPTSTRARSSRAGKSGRPPLFSTQTNATAGSSEMASFL
jgi:hypothetical protein